MKIVYVQYNWFDYDEPVYFRRGDRFEYGRAHRRWDGIGCVQVAILGHRFYFYRHQAIDTPLTRKAARKLSLDMIVHKFRKVNLNVR